MKINNIAMLLSAILMSEKGCNDLKLTKNRKESQLVKSNDNPQYSCNYQIFSLFLVALYPTFPLYVYEFKIFLKWLCAI